MLLLMSVGFQGNKHCPHMVTAQKCAVKKKVPTASDRRNTVLPTAQWEGRGIANKKWHCVSSLISN